MPYTYFFRPAAGLTTLATATVNACPAATENIAKHFNDPEFRNLVKIAAEILPPNASNSQKKAVTTAQEKVLKPLTHSLTYINSHGPFNPMQNTVGVSQMYAIRTKFHSTVLVCDSFDRRFENPTCGSLINTSFAKRHLSFN